MPSSKFRSPGIPGERKTRWKWGVNEIDFRKVGGEQAFPCLMSLAYHAHTNHG